MQQQTELPYNSANKLLSREGLIHIIQRYVPEGNFSKLDLFRTAFVHKSYCTRKNENFENGNLSKPPDCLPLQEESNERLEFLGDAVLNLVIGKYLFSRYPDESEGFLTKMRTKLVNGNMLAELCKYAGLEEFIIISKQIEDNGGRSNTKVLEDCFEAFLGAMYLDTESNHSVEKWIINLIEENIDFSELILSQNNYKDAFLKYFQHQYGYVPKFYEQQCDTVNGQKVYRVVIKDRDGLVVRSGKGKSKKEAENDASYQALLYYGAQA